MAAGAIKHVWREVQETFIRGFAFPALRAGARYQGQYPLATALSRPLIRESDLVNRWKSGDRRPARCISDNGCFKPALEGKGIYCTVAAKERER